MRRFTSAAWKLSVAFVWLLLLAPATHAGNISFVDMFRDGQWAQTGNGNSLSLEGFFFTSHLYSVSPGDYSTVQMTYPGLGSPVSLSPSGPSTFVYQTSLFASQAAMDSAFPTGTYSYTASGTSGTDSTSFSYTKDYYPQTQPYLTGTNFSNLQGMNSQSPFNFQFSTFTPAAGVNASYIFLDIYNDSTNSIVFNDGFLPSTTTGVTLPANTLQPGVQYTYQLIFSDRLTVPSPGANFDAQISYEYRSLGTFTTAAATPEPASIIFLTQGVVCSGWFFLRRRRRAISPAAA